MILEGVLFSNTLLNFWLCYKAVSRIKPREFKSTRLNCYAASIS